MTATIKKLLDEYYAMKTVGLGKDMKPSKDQVIMYDSKEEFERIQINEYLKWINTHTTPQSPPNWSIR